MPILVDTSVWVDYFRGGPHASRLDPLIDENLIATNELVLAELVPYLEIQKQRKAIRLLFAVNQLPLRIDWREIIRFQVQCLQAGANGVGLPDLIIAQNSKQNDCAIYSLDKHFQLLKQAIRVKLHE